MSLIGNMMKRMIPLNYLKSGNEFNRAVLSNKIIFFILSFVCLSVNTKAQWKQTNGPFGGFIGSIVAQDTNIYACSAYGIYRSTNNGNSWKLINKGMENSYSTAITTLGNRVFVATNDGIYSSENYGDSWILKGLATAQVTCLTVSENKIFAGTYGHGFLISSDSGDTWDTPIKLAKPNYIYSIVASKNKVITNTNEGLYFSSDSGSTWSLLANPLNSPFSHFLFYANKIYASCSNGIFVFDEAGNTWNEANIGLTNKAVWSIALSGNTLLASTEGSGVFISTDSARSWKAASTNLSKLSHISLAIAGSTVFAGTQSGGIYRSVDTGNTWIKSSHGIVQSDISALSSQSSKVFAATGGNGLYSTINGGDSWISANEGLPESTVTVLISNDSNYFVGTANDGVFISNDSGSTWLGANNGLTSYSISSLVMNGSSIYAGTREGIFVSINNAKSWRRLSYDGLFDYNINSIAILEGNLLVIATNYGIYTSSNNGDSWKINTSGITSIYSAALASNGSKVFASTPDGIYLSFNKCEFWNIMSSKLRPNCFAFYGNTIFVADDKLIYMSADTGREWTPVNEGLTLGNKIQSLMVSNHYLYAGTNNSGVWRRPLSEMNGVYDNAILNIYPNPSNTIINVTLSLQTAEEVTYTLYNQLGQIVLQNEYPEWSQTAIEKIDISQMPPGLYILSATGDDWITSKIVVVK